LLLAFSEFPRAALGRRGDLPRLTENLVLATHWCTSQHFALRYAKSAWDLRTTDLKLAPFPNSLAATLRGFAFYLALPISSIRGCQG